MNKNKNSFEGPSTIGVQGIVNGNVRVNGVPISGAEIGPYVVVDGLVSAGKGGRASIESIDDAGNRYPLSTDGHEPGTILINNYRNPEFASDGMDNAKDGSLETGNSPEPIPETIYSRVDTALRELREENKQLEADNGRLKTDLEDARKQLQDLTFATYEDNLAASAENPNNVPEATSSEVSPPENGLEDVPQPPVETEDMTLGDRGEDLEQNSLETPETEETNVERIRLFFADIGGSALSRLTQEGAVLPHDREEADKRALTAQRHKGDRRHPSDTRPEWLSNTAESRQETRSKAQQRAKVAQAQKAERVKRRPTRRERLSNLWQRLKLMRRKIGARALSLIRSKNQRQQS
jgi:hypothetical protein